MKKHEKLVQEVQTHQLRRQSRDFLCLWLEAEVQALTWMHLESGSSPKSECSAACVRTLVQRYTNTCPLPAWGGCPSRCPLLPTTIYSLHSWEQNFRTACSMVLMTDLSLHHFIIISPPWFLLASLPYLPPADPIQWLISSETPSPGPRLPQSPWQEGSGWANQGPNR